MIVFEARTYLPIAVVVWLVWRFALWRRLARDPQRELALAALFLWTLAVAQLTFFPLKIVLYDWHASINLVPFGSMLQLVTETSPTVARYNIAGNIALFVPYGVLLPLLFAELRTLRPFLLRILVISSTVEIIQLLTRARAMDVDDVILNTLGAALGFAIYTLAARTYERSRCGPFAPRLAVDSSKEPLLTGWVPIAATGAIVLPMMLSTVVGATIGDGPTGIVGFALDQAPTGEVVGRASVNGHTFLAISDGPATAERILLFEFVEPVPGRFTWASTSEIPPGDGSRFSWTLTAFNTEHDTGPVVAVWGANFEGATAMVVTGNGASERMSLPEGPHFVAAFQLDLDAEHSLAPAFDDFSISFYDERGADVSHLFDAVR